MAFTIISIVFIYFVLFVNVLAIPQSWEVNQNLKSQAYFGDMLLTPLQKLRYRGDTVPIRGVSRKESSFNRWLDNTIPYQLSPQYTEIQKQKVRTSLTSLESVSCFRFTERRDERDYLFIVPLDGCYSFVGKIGGRQKMSLAIDCLADYIIWHEVMHAIGFEHEHQRPDRDSFIHVEYSHVQPGQLGNFEKISSSEVDYPDTYDYKSIMHYDSFAFGKIDPKTRMRLATMTPLKKGVSLDDNIRLTTTDILKLNRLGNCNKHNSSSRLHSVANEINKNCIDIAKNCDIMKQKGLCTMGFYKLSMERQCALTCNLCKVRGVAITDKINRMTEIEDNDLDINIIKKEEKESAELPGTSCVDMDSNCSTFSRNGFCTHEFYKNIRKERCAKTCSLC